MLVSKGKFAEMVGRTPAAVSQWIAAGKLSGAALVGEGRYAQIDVEVAQQQLGITLDLGQQLAQATPLLANAGLIATPAAMPPAVTSDQERLLKARADREELARSKDEAEALTLRGAWMVTAEAEAAWSAQLARIIQAMESWLVTTAAGTCAGIAAGPDAASPRAYAVALRQSFESLCARLSKDAAQGAAPVADVATDDGEDA